MSVTRAGEAPISTGTGDILTPLGPDDPRETAGYRLLARIGEGGMGTVYLSHTRGGQAVALKVIRREFGDDPEFRSRFEQEVRAARRVQGYHLVPVVDHDTSGRQPWLASVFVPGMSLHSALADHGPLPPATVFRLVGCTAQALTAIHAAGVVHRDLKPGNILLGATGPYVIDFGIARAADATQLTRSGGLIGTPQFMSPEHALGEETGPATDVFSLGLIAALAATGRHPYGSGGAMTVAAQIANTEHRPPRLDGYPPELRPLLEGCLAADPQTRITPAELAALCERAAGRPLNDAADWLPEPLAAEIARRERAALLPPPPADPATDPAAVPTYPPGTGPSPTAPATGPGRPAPPDTSASYPTAPGPGAWAGYTPPGTPPATGPTAPLGPPPYAADPGGRQPAPRPAAGRPRPALFIALAAVAVVVAVVVTRSLTNSGGSRDDDLPTPPPSPATSESPSASPSDSQSPKSTYTLVFKDKPLIIRAPGWQQTTMMDFDRPKLNPHGGSSEDDRKNQEIRYFNGVSVMEFITPTGKSTAPTPEACRDAVDTNVMQDLDEDQLEDGKTLAKGTLLCTVTSDNNLAMLKIVGSHLVPGDFTVPGFDTELTLWKIDE
ncbi:protein kinase [Streptomyces sp. NPDC057697]|uniref:protein kinase domain-containing protein n=1 Tax=Streptomyces sp. NPDC057697 TaxID=3346219 RepID=UPI0036AA821C